MAPASMLKKTASKKKECFFASKHPKKGPFFTDQHHFDLHNINTPKNIYI